MLGFVEIMDEPPEIVEGSRQLLNPGSLRNRSADDEFRSAHTNVLGPGYTSLGVSCIRRRRGTGVAPSHCVR